MEDEKIIDVDATQIVEENKPSLYEGNYIIEVISEGNVIKKVLVANSSINITKLKEGGLTVDLA